ncbi:hypothetical protein DXG01_005008 [Tephrocybe rancida]|nr:hypothetical protein DXG01_005008 [Tephrocybe rancida]
MDVLLSIVTGLGLRLFLDSLDEPLGRLGPVLLGLWEGAAVHHLSAGSFSAGSSLDHYLAYTLRVAVDLYFTANIHRAFIVLLFTILGLVASEFTNPTRPRRFHRRRSSHTSVPTHIRHYAREYFPSSSRPARPSLPSTPPSIFLGGESELNTPHPGYPISFADNEKESFESPTPNPALFPTPPSTSVSEVRDTRAVDRLSTIEEHSSGEDGSRRSLPGIVPGAFMVRNASSYPPSVATPLPVPNSTIQYIHTSLDQANANPAVEPSPSPIEAPLPVPNSSTKYYMSEDDGGDPLQTPPAASSAPWELVLTDDNDGLTTPPARELSPLVLEHNLLPSFGQASTSAEAPLPNTSASVSTTEAAAALLVTSAVECLSTPVAPSHHNPDPITEPEPTSEPSPDELEPEPDPEPEPVSSYPTPVPSPTIERHSRSQQTDHHPNSDAGPSSASAEAEQETETETDAASVISSHPANVMYHRAEALREKARAAEAERFHLLEELKHTREVKRVLFLKQRVREEEELAKKLHDKAAKRFFEARNAMRKRRTHTVDVHGLRAAEAVFRTEQALRNALEVRAPSVRVIVGKGLHSAGKVPVLKGTITKVMQGYGLDCKVDPGNAGVLILTLPVS